MNGEVRESSELLATFPESRKGKGRDREGSVQETYQVDFLLPMVSPLFHGNTCSVSLAGAATSIIFFGDKHVFVATKHVFCHNKINVLCFFCPDKHIFVVTKLLMQQIFVTTDIILL